ncbi:Chk1 protein kinase [Chytridiales sp. JEL 0842]|nr:Chk1 protein kinase [Chytridiales sp. JEL 0842]
MKYNGTKVDLWSSGIILFVLLAGNTPWAEPTKNDIEFVEFVQNYETGLQYETFMRFSKPVLRLVMGLLNVDPEHRYTSSDIEKDPWFSRPNPLLTDGKCNNPVALAELMKSQLNLAGEDLFEPEAAISYSQPEAMRYDSPMDFETEPSGRHMVDSFSQPVRSYFNDSPTQDSFRKRPTMSQVSRQPFGDLLPSDRITRFFSPCDAGTIFKRLGEVLQQCLVPYKLHSKMLKISFTTVDRRKCPLHGDIRIQPVVNDVNELSYMVGFRKSKGDPLEFKRFYKAVAAACEDIVSKSNSIM